RGAFAGAARLLGPRRIPAPPSSPAPRRPFADRTSRKTAGVTTAIDAPVADPCLPLLARSVPTHSLVQVQHQIRNHRPRRGFFRRRNVLRHGLAEANRLAGGRWISPINRSLLLQRFVYDAQLA